MALQANAVFSQERMPARAGRWAIWRKAVSHSSALWRRALGDPEYKLKGGSCAVIAAPEVRRLRLRPGDAAVVLASDGLFDVMDDGEVVDVIEQARLATEEQGITFSGSKSWQCWSAF